MKTLKIQTEEAQLRQDTIDNNIFGQCNALIDQVKKTKGILSPEDFANIRQQLSMPKFISLENLIAFTQAIAISGQYYSPEKIEEFCKYGAFNDEINDFINNKFHPLIDESLVDTIYKQNPSRQSSITELFSNSKDAKAKNINITIKDGYYAVADNGVGMGPSNILFHLLNTRSTTKDSSADTIGRFGIGFFRALAHLNDEEDEITVDTKQAGQLGYRIRIIKANKSFYCHLNENASLSAIGTCIQVKAKEIKQAEYTQALLTDIQYGNTANTFINGEPVISKLPANIQPVSNSKLAYSLTQDESLAIITVGGITLQIESSISNDRNFLCVWDLPKETTLTETRKGIIIDSDFIRNEIKSLIDQLEALEDGDKINICNTIAPLIYSLQCSNNSPKPESNLLFYLQNKTQKIVSSRQQVPDKKKFIPLLSPQRIPIHPLLIPPYWQTRIGQLAPHWISTEHQVFIIDFTDKKQQENGQGFIYDRKNKTIYLDERLYKNYNADQWKLSSIFKLPPGEFIGKWQKFNSQSNKSQVFKVFSADFIKFGFIPHKLNYYSDGGFNFYIAENLDGPDKQELILTDAFSVICDKATQIKAKIISSQHAIVAIADFKADPKFRYGVYYKDGTAADFYTPSKNPPAIEKINEQYYIISLEYGGYLYNLKGEAKYYSYVKKIPGKPSLISVFSGGSFEGCYKIIDLDNNKEFYGLPIENSDLYLNWEDNKNNNVAAKDFNKSSFNNFPEEFQIINENGVEILNFNLRVIYSTDKFNCQLIDNNYYLVFITYSNLFLTKYDVESKKFTSLTSYNQNKNKLKPCCKVFIEDNGSQQILLVNINAQIFCLHWIQDIQEVKHAAIEYIKTQANFLLLLNDIKLVGEDGRLIKLFDSPVTIQACEQDNYLIINFIDKQEILQKKTWLIKSGGQVVDDDCKDVIRISANLYKIIRQDDTAYLYANGCNLSLQACLPDNSPFPIIFSSSKPYDVNERDKSHDAVIYDENNNPINENLLFDVNQIKRLADNIYYELPKLKLKYFSKGLNDDRIIQVLTGNELASSIVQENLVWLKQYPLTPVEHGQYVRFINLETKYFKALYPYMQFLRYIPTPEQANDYLYLLKYVEILPANERIVALQVLDIVYELCGIYSKETFAIKIIAIIAEYGIQVLETLFKVLKEDYIKFKISFDNSDNNFIGELPTETQGIAYYLFCSQAGFSNNNIKSLWQPQNSQIQRFSLLKLMTLAYLEPSIFDNDAPRLIIQKVLELPATLNQEIAQRSLTHAIYHQGRGSKLFIREFLQNALDAIKQHAQSNFYCSNNIHITINQDDKGNPIFRLCDEGIGMTANDIFKYLFGVGASTKRDSLDFIGGRGVGFFTAFDGAENIVIKTGTAISSPTSYFRIIPKYEKDKHNKLVIVDAEIEFYQARSYFKGFEVERTSLKSVSMIEPAIFYQEVMHHAKLIDGQDAVIFINDKRVRSTLQLLFKLNINDFGEIKIYKSTKNVVTAGGLYVSTIPKELLSMLPGMVRKQLLQQFIVIALPASTKLTRARDDFENRIAFFNTIIEPLTSALMGAFLVLFQKNFIELKELPYDFFGAQDKVAAIQQQYPQIEEDAEKLYNGKQLEDYSYYVDKEKLTYLFCFIRWIPFGINTKINLIELFKMYKQDPFAVFNNPNLSKYITYVMAKQIYKSQQEDKSAQLFNSIMQANQFDAHEWTLESNNCSNWKLFTELSEKLLSIFNQENPNKIIDIISTAYSTKAANANAYTRRQENFIYWNPIHIERIVVQLNDAFAKDDFSLFEKALKKMVFTLTHEYVHVHETPCSGTHEHKFFKNQRAVYLQSYEMLSANDLFNEFKIYYNNTKDQAAVSAVEFIKVHTL